MAEVEALEEARTAQVQRYRNKALLGWHHVLFPTPTEVRWFVSAPPNIR